MRGIRVLLASTALLAAAFGCGLLDTGFTFTTDPQSFTLDTAQLGLTVPAGSKIPGIPCTASPDNCATAAAAAQVACSGGSYGCAIGCKSGNCAISATAEFATPVDVSGKIKNNTQASVVSKASLQRLALVIKENTLTFATPTIDVFVGPSSATKTTDAGVVKLGTIPAIPSKQTATQDIPTTTEGNDALSQFIKNYQQPFKMLAKASLTFASGDAIPQGRLAFDVIAYIEVKP
jgi:hypothetical protein